MCCSALLVNSPLSSNDLLLKVAHRVAFLDDSLVVSTSVTVDGGPPSPATCNHRFRYYISRVTVTKAAAAKDGAKSATTMLALSSNPKNKSKNGSGGFESLYLSPPIFAGIKRLGYRTPTPVQRKSLPVLLTGSDAVVMARTGSEFR